MAIRAVVFDLFDTLVDLVSEDIPMQEHGGRRIPAFVVRIHDIVSEHVDVDLDRFLEVFRAIDRDLRESHYAKGLEVPSSLRFDRLVQALEIADAGLSEFLVAHHMSGLRAQVREVEHHPAVLEGLRSHARIGVCSNFSHSPTAVSVLAEAALDAHLDAVVISDAVGIRKPRGEIFEAVLAQLDVAPAEALHVGDNLEADVAGAAALGMRTAWVTRRIADPAKVLGGFQGPAPDHQIADLDELEAIVEAEGAKAST